MIRIVLKGLVKVVHRPSVVTLIQENYCEVVEQVRVVVFVSQGCFVDLLGFFGSV